MSADSIAAPRGTRGSHAASAAAHLAVAIGLGALAIASASIRLPVELSVPTAGAIGTFAHVDFAAAAAVVVLIGVMSHALAAAVPSWGSQGQRGRLLQLVAFAQSSAITVFLMAQVNGVTEAGALILIYAMAGGAAGVLWLQARENDGRARAPWPFSLGAALAVVPWGIVALYQIASLAAGSPPSALVRIVTVVILLLAGVAWWVERRVQLGALAQRRSAVLQAVVSLASGLSLLVLAAGLAGLPSFL